MSGRRSSRKTRKNPPVSEQPQQPPQAEEEAQKVEEEGPSLAELTVPPPPKDDRGKGRGKKGKARDKRKRRDSHEDSDAEEVQSEAAQEEADSEDEAESEVPVTEKKWRKAKAPAVNLTPEQEEDISEWLKLNPWLWDKNEKDYRLRDTKQGGCNDKAAEMGLTAAELRRRIKTLKDIAVKALKPPPSGAGGRICTPQQQRCVELFGFLAKKVVRRPGRTTLKGVQPRPLVQVQEEVQEEEEGTDEESRIELTGDIPPPQPRRRDRRRGAAIKEHEDLLEAMRRSLADSSAITQRVESALGTAAPPPTDPRLLERHTYGQWFMSILPSIADDHWFAFRRDINKIVDHFQEISVTSQRPAAQSAQSAQSLQTAQQGMALFHAMDQPATQTSQQQQQQFFKPPSTSQFVSTSTSSTSCEQMPDWQRKYQRADQDFLIPEGQTTFTPAQLSYLPEPNQVTRIVRVQHVPHAQQQQQLVVPGQLPQKTFAHLRPVRVPTATATATTGAAALSFSPAVRQERSQSAPSMQSSMDLGSNTPVFLGTPEASPLPDPSPQSTGLGDSFSSLLKDLE